MPDPTLLGTCDENLPLSPIMRQFDFGQFVVLHQKMAPGTTPPGAAQRFRAGSQPIVLDPSGGILQARQEWLQRKQKLAVAPPRNPREDLLGGVSLEALLVPADELSPVEMEVASTALADVVRAGEITHDGHRYSLDIDSVAADALARGEPALVLASNRDAPGARFMTQLKPDIPTVALGVSEVDTFLASGAVRLAGVLEHVEIESAGAHALLDGEPVVVWANGGSNTIIRLVPPAPARPPARSSVVIGDLAEFLSQPQVEGDDGRPIALTLTAANISEFRAAGVTTIPVAGTSVSVRDGGFGLPPRLAPTSAARFDRRAAEPLDAAPFGRGDPLNGQHEPRRQATEPARLPHNDAIPPGVPLAVFLPWRQTWELTGFSRGELRSSLALAPQEQTTIEVSSWERRLRTLDQSSQTDVDQTFESSQTERASDDVFSEMTKHHDFNWQVDGSLDASYSTGTGSISVSVGGEVSDASQLQSIARTTKQGMKESTQKAAAKIRSVRTTHITDAIEGGTQSRVTRQIKNPNFSHTLTLDFFETLAHYKVTLAAIPDRLTLVALIPNPMALAEFNPGLIRSNEVALRRALLDSSLVAGFDACRKTSAYRNAISILEEQATMGAVNDNATNADLGKTPADPPKVPSAQEKAVVDLLRQIAAAYGTVSTAKAVGQTPESPGPSQLFAMGAIGAKIAVTEVWRTDAQHCLFLQLGSKFLPGLLDVIKKLPKEPTIADAAALAAAIPPPQAPMSLAKFRDVSSREKEEAGLGAAIATYIGSGTMGWANGQCLNNNLYTPDDAGLAGLADNLWTAYQKYLAKQSEGDFKQEQAVQIENAKKDQDKLSTADKLAMAFPLDELASAREREEALLKHLNEHQDHYRFALFQGLSPAEQSAYIEASGLPVGTFEPRVLAISGPKLAVPLAPPPAGPQRTFLESVRSSFEAAFGGTADKPDTFVFPTPGMTINSRLGECTACEDFIERSRTIELRRLAAEADSAEHEAARRAARLVAKELDDPVIENAPLHITLDRPTV